MIEIECSQRDLFIFHYLYAACFGCDSKGTFFQFKLGYCIAIKLQKLPNFYGCRSRYT